MRVIYVDDEELLLENFRLTICELPQVEDVKTFQRSEDALFWAEHHVVDVAFLDINMVNINGIELAKRLKNIDENIRIVFVTAYEQYALQAFRVDAIGYLLKPYSAEDIEKELKKASHIRKIPKKEIKIITMPKFRIEVNGKQVLIGHTKPEELLALLIDRGEAGLTKTEAVSCLWSGYSSDSIYWTTMSRLKAILVEEGIFDIIITKGQTKYLNKDMVDCDLYRMLDGDNSVITAYNGEYLSEYVWAKERRMQLNAMKKKFFSVK